MIVPRDRLLFVFALVVLPAATMFVEPGYTWVAALAIAAVIGVALVDAARARERAEHIKLSASSLLRVKRLQPAALPIIVESNGSSLGELRVGLPEVSGLGCTEFDKTVALAETGASSIEFDLLPPRRGVYKLQNVAYAVSSPFGLWNVRKQVPLDSTISVYPDLAKETELAPLLLRGPAGFTVQRQMGKGREFEKLREYMPGDPMGDIHWKATARRSKPVTRVFQIERTQEIYIIIDCSRLSAMNVAGDTVIERFVTTVLAMLLTIRQHGDLAGLLVFSDKVHHFLRAASGPAQYDAIREVLVRVQANSAPPDYSEAFATLQNHLRRRALLLFLTQLDDPALAEDFERAAAPSGRRHLIVAGQVQPETARPLFSKPANSATDVYRALAGYQEWKQIDGLRKRMRAVGVRYLAVDARSLPLEMAKLYSNLKRQQAL